MENILLGGIALLTTVLFFNLMHNHEIVSITNRFEQRLKDLKKKD